MSEIKCLFNCGNLTVEGSDYCEDCLKIIDEIDYLADLEVHG